MAVEVTMPKLGLLMTEGVIVQWLKEDGDSVATGEPIVDIMTQKITYQIDAPADGILRRVAQVDETLRIGETIGFVTAPGEALPAADRTSARPAAPPGTPTTSTPAAPDVAPNSRGSFVVASPWARRLAKELGVELARVKGSGPGGRVIGSDVYSFAAERARARQATPGGRAHTESSSEPALPARQAHERTVPFVGIRKVIAERMTESLRTMAQATITAEVDVTGMVRRRTEVKAQFKLSYTDIIVKAVTTALKKHPQLNSTLIGDEIHLLDEIHIGVAVPLKEGLIVPVIRDADQRTLAEIAQERRHLIEAARSGTLMVDQVTGSTFSIINLGMYGVDFFGPIINPPEVAILGVGRVVEKPVMIGGEVAGRSMMMFCLSFDQRVVDAAPAAAFLRTLARLLAKPDPLFI